MSSSVLTWTDAPPAGALISERLRRLRASHHGMWNYVTYRDAIGLLGMDAAKIYPANYWLSLYEPPPANALPRCARSFSAIP